MAEFASKTIWAWRVLFQEFLTCMFNFLYSGRALNFSLVYWGTWGSLCFVRNGSFHLNGQVYMCGAVCSALMMSSGSAVIPAILFLILEMCVLPLFFFVSFARSLSILLIFKKQLFVLLVFSIVFLFQILLTFCSYFLPSPCIVFILFFF